MRIVLLSDRIPPENQGGAGQVAWNLAQGLKHAGHDVHVIAATPQPYFEAIRAGIPTYHVHSDYPPRLRSWLSLYNPQVIPTLRQLLKRLQPVVVNAHNIHADISYAALKLAYQMGIRTIFSAHDMMTVTYGKVSYGINPAKCGMETMRLPAMYNLKRHRFRYNPVRNLVIKAILQRYTHARVAISHIHKAALEANGLPQFEVISNGLDPDDFARPSEAVLSEFRAKYQLNGRKVLLFGGRLSHAKGGEQLLAALNLLVKTEPQAKLLILSNKPIDRQMLARLPNLYDDHIQETGWLEGESLRAAYYLADVITFPSVYLDAFGMINLEGMAAHKPLVSTCYGGAPEVVKDGETGYIVNPYDTEQFAQYLISLLKDDKLRKQMGEAGHHRLLQHFALHQQVANYEKLFII